MKILVLNLGSTSFKFKLFDFNKGEEALASGGVESIGSPKGAYSISLPGFEDKGECTCAVHGDAMDLCINILIKNNVIKSIADVDAVGYKAVHGGSIIGARMVDDDLINVMESFASFVPAHNPIYTSTMRALQDKYPDLKQVAYFETSFHATMPEYRAIYGVPYEWYKDYGIRRYGFHGSSHSYIAWKLSELEPEAKKIVSIHLGGSSSLCAIDDGISIAESMGATTQSGLFHNNRVGDLDVFCIPDLIKKHNGDVNEVFTQLSSKGGFLGISGVSNDLREVLKAREEGNERADLAVNAFVDNIVGYIGMFAAYLEGLDSIVFTGGIGQKSSIIREMVCSKLSWLSLYIDSDKNQETKDQRIDTEKSRISVWVLETNEELMVARQAYKLIKGEGY
ncbi:MAG: acetate/propionate family kinase [Clostridiaceae bacterium]|nr:acetate/propionate family kinase [Clostridiaceae bacterium]